VLGAPGWRQADHARWQPVAIGSAVSPRGPEWMLQAGDEQAFREFFSAICAARRTASVSWALGRFEMGCARPTDAEALSDHLLGLRALLDATTETNQASFGLRLAALCAEEGVRREVQERMEAAVALERFVMGGSGGVRLDVQSPRDLIAEVEAHLRALLRDVLCGYLDADLKAVADDILLESHGDPLGEIEVRDLREDPHAEAEPDPPVAPRFDRPQDTEPMTFEPELEWDAEPDYDADYEPDPDHEAEHHHQEAEYDDEPDTAEIEPVAVTSEPVQHELDGVTQSADWGWNDPEDFSAPV
jgi:hypothetical protein